MIIVPTTIKTGSYVEMVSGNVVYGTTTDWTEYFEKIQTFIIANFSTHEVVAQDTADTDATFRLECTGHASGCTYDLLRKDFLGYVLLKKSASLYECICYLEYVRVNGSEFHASEIEAFNIDTIAL